MPKELRYVASTNISRYHQEDKSSELPLKYRGGYGCAGKIRGKVLDVKEGEAVAVWEVGNRAIRV